MATASEEIVEKSVAACISAIEIYNKPDFKYREETFSILMTNAWELLLKAKWIRDHGENVHSIEEVVDGNVKLNRCGNPITYGMIYLLDRIHQQPKSALTQPCYENILLLVEVRDNSIHFINKDLYFARRIQDIGTATLRNYLSLVDTWFSVDLSRYNFFLMPLSFFHGFEAATPASVTKYSEQMQKLLKHLAEVENSLPSAEGAAHEVSLSIETKFLRSKDAGSLPFKWTDDKTAPVITMKEEDVLQAFPYSYTVLRKKLAERYTDFVCGTKFHKIRKTLEANPKLCKVRFLDPGNAKSGRKVFYSTEVFKEFDKHYQRK